MDQPKPFLTPSVAIVIGSIVISLAILVGTGTISLQNNVKGVKTTTVDNKPAPTTQQNNQSVATVTPTNPKIKTFSEKKDAQILKEDGKPVIYLFSTTWCPHCQWIKETFDKVAKEYVDAGEIKAYHWEIDTNDNTLTEAKEDKVPEKDMVVYQEFNPQGSIPTFVFGGKYFRTGNGYEKEKDLVLEEAEFRAVIEDLINNP